MSQSPQKCPKNETKLYGGDEDCKMIDLESLETPYVVPLMMNYKRDNEHLISRTIPLAIQANSTFLVDADKLPNRKDIFYDDNGSWRSKGCTAKFYITNKDENGIVHSLTRCKTEEEGDITVRRWPYICKSCPEYHKTTISIEYGKSIVQWFRIVLLRYYFENEEKKFVVKPHGDRQSSAQPYVRTRESTKEK